MKLFRAVVNEWEKERQNNFNKSCTVCKIINQNSGYYFLYIYYIVFKVWRLIDVIILRPYRKLMIWIGHLFFIISFVMTCFFFFGNKLFKCLERFFFCLTNRWDIEIIWRCIIKHYYLKQSPFGYNLDCASVFCFKNT